MRNLFVLLILSMVFVMTPGKAVSGETQIAFQTGEHPADGEDSGKKEHSSGKEGSASKEGSEHPTQKKTPVTIESVANYLEGYVGEKAAAQGGWMEVRDDEADKTLKLQLDKIHRERLAKTAEGTYFVCADFNTPEGSTYDLDFWVKETDHGLRVTETTVHKEEGKPRYTWVEKDGIWSRKYLSDK